MRRRLITACVQHKSVGNSGSVGDSSSASAHASAGASVNVNVSQHLARDLL
jgi:hypothetical protein